MGSRGKLRPTAGMRCALAVAAGLGACPEPAGVCDANSDCRGGEVCVYGICRDACNSSAECKRNEYCNDGVCLPAPPDAGAADQRLADSASGDTSAPDIARPDARADDTAPLDVLTADVGQPDHVVVDTLQLDRSQLDALPADTAQPDLGTADAPRADAARPDAAADGSAGDDRATHDATVADTAPPDTSVLDAAVSCDPPPSAISLDCTAPPGAVSGTSSTCTLQAQGAAPEQSACLSCTARTGFVLVDHSDFEDERGACSQDDWTLVSGAHCSDTVSGCTPGGVAIDCCDDFASICDEGYSGARLKTEMGANCGGGYKQWRLTRLFDLSGLHDLWLCYDAYEVYATAADAIIAQVEDDGGNQAQLSCTLGSISWRGGFLTRCAQLPVWADGNGQVRVTFIAHSNATDQEHVMRLDNVVLYGWHAECQEATRRILFEENFASCASPIPDGWNGWLVDGAPTCGAAGCTGEQSGAYAVDGASWTMAHYVDTRPASGDLQLCLLAGDDNTGQDDNTMVSIDVGDGAGWSRSQRGTIYAAPDRACERLCFNLSADDRRVEHNPFFGFRVEVETNNAGEKNIVDDMELSGAQSCDAAASLALGPVTAIGSGLFELTVSKLTDTPLPGEISCEWADASVPVTAYHQIEFR